MHNFPETNLYTRTNKNCTLKHFYEYVKTCTTLSSKSNAEQLCKYVLCYCSNLQI